MKTKQWISMCVVAWLAGAGWFTRSLAGTSDVFLLKVAASAVAEADVGAVEKVKVTAGDIALLALGRGADDSLATNEVLALAHDCQNETLELIVYDRNDSSKLATVAVMTEAEGVESGKSGQFVLFLDVQSPGSELNRLNGGKLAWSGKYSIGTNGCPAKVSGTLTGFVDITITDPGIGTHSILVLIPKGSVSAVKKIGTLAE